MAKKQKKSKENRKAPKPQPTKPQEIAEPILVPQPAEIKPATSKERPLLRAIRVTSQVLEAAKAYKRVTGVSFYQLGLDAISERLTKEGYLNEKGEPSSREPGVAKA